MEILKVPAPHPKHFLVLGPQHHTPSVARNPNSQYFVRYRWEMRSTRGSKAQRAPSNISLKTP